MTERVPLGTIAKSWTRLGCIGFGGPPTHIALLRRMCVEENKWIDGDEFEDGIAATNLLPGPASTQLAIFSAWRVGGPAGALIGGLGFIVPGLALILGLSAVFLAGSPPVAVLGAAAGAGAAVPAVALHAAADARPVELGSHRHRSGRARAVGLVRARGWRRRCHGRTVPGARAHRLRPDRSRAPPRHQAGRCAARARRACGRSHCRRGRTRGARVGRVQGRRALLRRRVCDHPADAARCGARVPLDDRRTVPERGCPWSGDARSGRADRRDRRLRRRGSRRRVARRCDRVRSFLPLRSDRRASLLSAPCQPVGAGVPRRCRAPAIGAIAGSTIPLALALGHWWQVPILVAALAALLLWRRGVVVTILGAAIVGLVVALAGTPV